MFKGQKTTGGNGYTVELWFKKKEFNGYREMLSQWTNAAIGNSFYLGMDNGNMRFTDSWGTVNVGALQPDTWYHLAAVSTPTNAMIYINGELKATKGSSLTYSGNGPLLLGRQGELHAEYFDGALSDVRIWNTARSAQEIQDNMTQALAGNEPGLTGYWKLKDVSRNILFDSTVGNNHGELYGKVKANLTLDGNDDYGVLSKQAVVPPGGNAFTVELWFKKKAFTGTREMLSQWTQTASWNSFYLGMDNGSMRFTDSWNPVNVGVLQADKWYHVAGVSTPTNAFIYINGELRATKGSPLTYTGNGPLILGRQGELSSEYFDGFLSDVRIWNTARSAQQIRESMTQALMGSESGLTGYWKLADVSRNILFDSTKGHNHGDLYGKGIRNLTLDGIDDYVVLSNEAMVPPGGNTFTVELWFKKKAFTGTREMISQWTQAASGNSFYLGMDNGNMRFTDSWGAVNVGPLEADAWYHVAAVSTPTNAFIYINGELRATKGSPLTYTKNGPLVLGRQGELSSEYFDGFLSDVRIWNTARSLQQIQENMTQILTENESGLKGYWRLNGDNYKYSASNELLNYNAYGSTFNYEYDLNGNLVRKTTIQN
ncbi:LamG domain-containing protein [Paenibacillus sp. WQ 127069]|uniref:LamG domain-containing protein n=1 Tax=Paenibacillus baimaensis TaxID=2982185 RepID=A0ABT2USE5_9BACL|nr:LamG domain-containing protein [Paenibacillus sp. WQ 127069]MCU6797584.1 LamG domain-containing protein [Paenibacillus sp. WQ 127069]